MPVAPKTDSPGSTHLPICKPLSLASADNQIWIAQGTYKPSNSDNTADHFNPPAGVKIYGGFNGYEASLNQRDWRDNRVRLSGDLLGNDNANILTTEPTRTDNSANIMKLMNKGEEVILDGLTFTGGGSSALLMHKSVVTIENCVFEKNTGNSAASIFDDGDLVRGGGGTLKVFNTVIQDNMSHRGGNFHICGGTNFEIKNCVFRNNETKSSPTGYEWGGALFISQIPSNAVGTIHDSLFINNYASNSGGAIFNQGKPRLKTVPSIITEPIIRVKRS